MNELTHALLTGLLGLGLAAGAGAAKDACVAEAKARFKDRT